MIKSLSKEDFSALLNIIPEAYKTNGLKSATELTALVKFSSLLLREAPEGEELLETYFNALFCFFSNFRRLYQARLELRRNTFPSAWIGLRIGIYSGAEILHYVWRYCDLWKYILPTRLLTSLFHVQNEF